MGRFRRPAEGEAPTAARDMDTSLQILSNSREVVSVSDDMIRLRGPGSEVHEIGIREFHDMYLAMQEERNSETGREFESALQRLDVNQEFHDLVNACRTYDDIPSHIRGFERDHERRPEWALRSLYTIWRDLASMPSVMRERALTRRVNGQRLRNILGSHLENTYLYALNNLGRRIEVQPTTILALRDMRAELVETGLVQEDDTRYRGWVMMEEHLAGDNPVLHRNFEMWVQASRNEAFANLVFGRRTRNGRTVRDELLDQLENTYLYALNNLGRSISRIERNISALRNMRQILLDIGIITEEQFEAYAALEERRSSSGVLHGMAEEVDEEGHIILERPDEEFYENLQAFREDLEERGEDVSEEQTITLEETRRRISSALSGIERYAERYREYRGARQLSNARISLWNCWYFVTTLPEDQRDMVLDHFYVDENTTLRQMLAGDRGLSIYRFMLRRMGVVTMDTPAYRQALAQFREFLHDSTIMGEEEFAAGIREEEMIGENWRRHPYFPMDIVIADLQRDSEMFTRQMTRTGRPDYIALYGIWRSLMHTEPARRDSLLGNVVGDSNIGTVLVENAEGLLAYVEDRYRDRVPPPRELAQLREFVRGRRRPLISSL